MPIFKQNEYQGITITLHLIDIHNINNELKDNIQFDFCMMLLPAVVTCSVLLTPENGNKVDSGRDYSDTATFSCSPGYLLKGSNLRTCQLNGEWSGIQPECISKRSMAVPAIYSNTPYISLIVFSHIGTSDRKCQK